MDNHTPTPWVLNVSNHGVVSVVGDNGRTVCDDEEYYPHAVSEEDMRFIAIACSSYHPLVSALEELKGHVGAFSRARYIIDAALAKAESK